MRNYQSAIERIKEANTLQELFSVGEGLERVHKIGQLTDNEFSRLDKIICDKINADFLAKAIFSPVEVRQ